MFCDSSNLTAPSGECDGGYYCVSGIYSRRPELSNLTVCPISPSLVSAGGVCPAGYYCPKGSYTYNGISILFLNIF